MIRLGILGSTRGTNLKAIIDAIAQDALAAEVAVVISNKPDAGILTLAATAGLPAKFVEPTGLTRVEYDASITAILRQYHVDIIVLVGYMRILSPEFTHAWPNRIINVHPSLLPAFAGMMDLAVHQAVIAAKERQTGCTVHYVTEVVDAGPIILQKSCDVQADDTPDLLKKRVQALEGEALIDALNQLSPLLVSEE